MTFETPNDRSTFLFFMPKSVRVDNFMNKFDHFQHSYKR